MESCQNHKNYVVVPGVLQRSTTFQEELSAEPIFEDLKGFLGDHHQTAQDLTEQPSDALNQN